MLTSHTEDVNTRRLTLAAAIIIDDRYRLLLVRKRGSRWFMQAGGKIDRGETPDAALTREIREELGVEIRHRVAIEVASAPAANEAGFDVEAHLFWAAIAGTPQATAEIEEIRWVTLEEAASLDLAPLTRDAVLPLVREWRDRQDLPTRRPEPSS
ncbi:NUDIX hydrolase [Salinicola avicenniae]|uniref:NUDIX hydrolase n=1 Tax=Salinicola avicenniae TaxID=2916836 RepID=UPI0020749BDB|nr:MULTISPECIES: NUDIX domain-containing protein [unclassified Salinicola]